MNNLLANTIQQEIDALQAQLNTIEERAAALRATIAQYKEALSAEQQTAAEAKQTALSALTAAQAAQELLANLPVVEPSTVETPYMASPEEDDEVEIELVYADEEDDDVVETPSVESSEVVEELPEVSDEPEFEEDDSLKDAVPVSPQGGTEGGLGLGVGGGFPIQDIRKAISLGDRFLFQRELFAGNGELMNKTIDKLNSLTSLEEALAYISKHFSWDTDSPAYELFTNILKRRW